MWKVLIVDDIDSTLILLSGMLKGHANCVCANNAKDALAEFIKALDEGNPFECVLLDYEMPETDGLKLIDQIRTAEIERNILPKGNVPLVMVTAHPKVFMKSFNSGGDYFILKPVGTESVVSKVKEMVDKYRAKDPKARKASKGA